MIQPIPTTHNTKWESLPATLRPPVLTTAEKVWRVVWNIISVIIPIIGLVRLAAYGLGILARRHLLLPASNYTEGSKADCRAHFEEICRIRNAHFVITPHTVITPDGAELSAHFFRHRNANAQTPTTIYFSGNGALKGMGGWDWLLRQSVNNNTPLNLVVFDYRSVDESTGTFNTSKDLLIDAASMVDWVRNAVKTPDDRINLYGMSLGGAVSVKTGAADEKLTGWVVNDRSFSSLEEFIKTVTTNLRWFLKPLVTLAIWILKNQELEIDAAADLGKLKGRKLVICHVKDLIIPYGASMARKFPEHAFKLNEQVLNDNHHCSDLDKYPGAKERVSNFIFA